jgi:hypothetical protein
MSVDLTTGPEKFIGAAPGVPARPAIVFFKRGTEAGSRLGRFEHRCRSNKAPGHSFLVFLVTPCLRGKKPGLGKRYPGE